MWAKLELEFCDKFTPIVHPEGTIVCVEGTEEVGFEPLKHHTFEVGLRECDFGSIRVEGSSPVLEVKHGASWGQYHRRCLVCGHECATMRTCCSSGHCGQAC